MGQSIGNLFRFLLGANCQTVSMVLFANLHTPFQLSVCLCRLCLSLCFLYFSAACVNLSFTLCLLWIFHLFFADMFIACAYLSLVPTLPDRSLLKSFSVLCHWVKVSTHCIVFEPVFAVSVQFFFNFSWVFAPLFTPRTQGYFHSVGLFHTSRSSKKASLFWFNIYRVIIQIVYIETCFLMFVLLKCDCKQFGLGISLLTV